MTHQATAPTSASTDRRPASGTAIGFTIFAGSMMMLAGTWQALQGLSALFDDDLFLSVHDYVFKLDLTAWGWIHLVLGVLVLLAGLGVLAGNVVARLVGIGLAGLSAVANFLAIPYYPFWSIAIIAVDVFVIWALALHGRDIAGEGA